MFTHNLKTLQQMLQNFQVCLTILKCHALKLYNIDDTILRNEEKELLISLNVQ